MNEKKHKKKVISIDGCGIPIDMKLVPLIKELNKVGLKTCHCCEGHPQIEDATGLAYISIDNSNLGIDVELSNNRIILRWRIHNIGWVKDEFNP